MRYAPQGLAFNCLAGKCIKAEDMQVFGFCACDSRFGCDFQGMKTGAVKWLKYNDKDIQV